LSDHDLVDPVTLLIATGLRRSESLGLRWTDYDDDACATTVSGKVIRVAGEGLQRVDETKSAAGRRTVPLPRLLSICSGLAALCPISESRR
jgi:integrase